MNYTKAQKEVFDALCSGKRAGRFDIDGNNIFVSPDGFRAYIFPKNIICFGLEKIAELKQFPVKELIQDQYQLTLTPDLRIIDAHRTARRLKGDGKNVLVNVKFLSCFQNPRFYQAKKPSFRNRSYRAGLPWAWGNRGNPGWVFASDSCQRSSGGLLLLRRFVKGGRF